MRRKKRPAYRYYLLLMIFLLALVYRLLFTINFKGMPLAGDEVTYHSYAESIVTGRGYIVDDRYRSYYPPLYPLFLAGVYHLAGVTPYAARLVQAALGAVICLLVYLIGLELYGAGVGLLAAAAAALYCPLIFQGGFLMSETLYVFLFSLGVLFSLRFLRRPDRQASALAGLCFGLAALVRQQGLLALGILLLVAYFSRGALGLTRRRALRLILPAALAACAVVLPWTLRNALVYKRFVLIDTHGGSTAFMCNHPGGSDAAKQRIRRELTPRTSDIEENDHFYRLVREEIRRAPAAYFLSFMPRKIAREAARYVSLPKRKIPVPYVGNALLISWPQVVPLLLVGLVVAFRREPRLVFVYLLMVLQVVLVVVLVMGYTRYRLHNIPFYLVLAAQAAVLLWGKARAYLKGGRKR